MESATGLLYINVGIDRGRHDPRRRPLFRCRPAGLMEDLMGRDDRNWIPDATDLDWIESTGGRRCPPALAAIEAAAEPLGIPIVDRDSGRVLSGPRRRPAADRRGRDGVRLLDAVDGPRPARRRHDRDHRPGPRADRPRARLVAPGGHRRRADHGRQRARRSRRSRPASRRSPARSTSPSSTRSSPSTRRYLEALTPPPRAGRARRRRQRPVERAGLGRPAGRGGRRQHRGAARVRRGASSPTRASARRSCRVGDGLLIASWRG